MNSIFQSDNRQSATKKHSSVMQTGIQTFLSDPMLNAQTAAALRETEDLLRSVFAGKKKKAKKKRPEVLTKAEMEPGSRSEDMQQECRSQMERGSEAGANGRHGRPDRGIGAGTYGAAGPSASEKQQDRTAPVHDLQQAVIWAEILGEPVCRKRKIRRNQASVSMKK